MKLKIRTRYAIVIGEAFLCKVDEDTQEPYLFTNKDGASAVADFVRRDMAPELASTVGVVVYKTVVRS